MLYLFFLSKKSNLDRKRLFFNNLSLTTGAAFDTFSNNLIQTQDLVRKSTELPTYPSGWPDWAMFRQFGGCFLSGSFYLIFGLLFCISFVLICTKNGLGYILSVFYKLIWSPCTIAEPLDNCRSSKHKIALRPMYQCTYVGVRVTRSQFYKLCRLM
jgi:hypothetical protein